MSLRVCRLMRYATELYLFRKDSAITWLPPEFEAEYCVINI